jgi:predicted nucleic-acid-binding Zn-ribbon protein
MAVKCPKCGNEKFFYVQDVTEYHTIEAVQEGGFVDLECLVESYPDETFHFHCDTCGDMGPEEVPVTDPS